MRRMIRENMQAILMVLLLFFGFYHAVESAWTALLLPQHWWTPVVFIFTAGFLNVCFIAWIQCSK